MRIIPQLVNEDVAKSIYVGGVNLNNYKKYIKNTRLFWG